MVAREGRGRGGEGRGRGRGEGEGEGEGEGGEVTDIKSNNPHLTGRELQPCIRNVYTVPNKNRAVVTTNS